MKKRGIITLVAIFGALFFGLMVFITVLITAFSPDGFGGVGESIGIIEVEGPIMESKKTVEDIRRFQKDENVKAVVVRVDSPGGAVAPSQEIFEAVKALNEVKPVAISMGSTAASGGYYIACGAETIFANNGTLTGSIGVITQFFNVEGILDTVAVDVHTIKSGEFKDSGSPFREFLPKDEAVFAEMVMDIHSQFVEDVAECRGLEESVVRRLADGRVYTGRQAKANKLVDEIGTLHDTIDFLAEKVGLTDPPVVYPPEEPMGFVQELMSAGVRSTTQAARDEIAPRVQLLYTGPQ
ncbi:signal peptide peptidase SppA [Lujinxingia litoralis]|uniref:Signal peptide peptidase SppA n=1 Tax=Lujinxingia litoralis TaxID=2211119 RepID=A0A328CB84_9DELT|nr:signal peptide peptidase SppA [Lujinxingia litoralis]RAL25288.1 signal peptide peptidase SppA [Lujinxingia litoralis]